MPNPYQKPWLSYQDQIKRLESRGMIVNDEAAAMEFLQHLNYYRFSGYGLAFETARHQFQDSVTFEQVQEAYHFDQTLRDVVTEALEIVEIDSRTAIAYHFGETHGPFGHTHAENFSSQLEHPEWLVAVRRETKRSKELFVRHFKATYQEYPNLPVWVATELITFGSLSRMYEGMHKKDQREIAHRYGLQRQDYASWLHHLNYVRNLCAHHARLWDRIWSIKPRLPHGKAWRNQSLLPGNNRLFMTLLILNAIMKRCPAIETFRQEWKSRIETLLNNPPAAIDPFQKMGLADTWKTHPLWMGSAS